MSSIFGDKPVVGIIMGSQSDMPTMEACMKQLEELDVPYEVKVASAHRKPAEVHEWASSAVDRGIRVIIAAAGKAAHLAGVLAAHTTLPVIGIPVKSSTLDGFDALLATVQMPSGIPVATVAIDGAQNAALLAAEMLAIYDDALAARLDAMRRDMEAATLEKDRALREKLEKERN